MHPYSNVADGQLAATSTTMYTAGVEGGPVNVILSNTGAKKTIILTILRPGSSAARRVRRIVLVKNESDIVTGLPMSPADILAGYDGAGGSTDYTVSLSNSPLSIQTRDASGFPKASAEVTLTVDEKPALTIGEMKILKVLEDTYNLFVEKL